MKLTQKLSTLCVSILTASTAFAIPANLLCTGETAVLGYFNSEWESEMNAITSAYAASRLFNSASTQSDALYRTEVFYNYTGSDLSEAAFAELTESFTTQASTISSETAQSFEIFWSGLKDDSNQFLADAQAAVAHHANVTAAGDASLSALESLTNALSTSAQDIATTFNNTVHDASATIAQTSRVTALALEGKNLLLLGFSQGADYAAAAYDVAIALNGYSAENASLLTAATSTALQSTDTLYTYIDGNNAEGLGSLISTAAGTLVPLTQVAASEGAFTVTLTWDGLGDVDLYTYEPSDLMVWFNSPVGDSGFLDVDNTYGYGPEHYFASCDADVLQRGTYTIALNNYEGAQDRLATVQVSTADTANLITKTVVMGPEGDYLNPNTLLTVNVTEAVNGDIFITAQ